MTLKNKHGQPLTVWYLSPHDKIPSDSWGYDRALIQIDTLRAAGCRVVFWAASFSHSTKQVRGAPWQKISVRDGFDVRLVPVRGYQRHGSLARMGSLFDFGWNMWRQPTDEPAPDLIVSVMPTPFIDVACVLLARRHGARFVQDFRDLWPELFVHAFPKAWQGLGRILIKPLQWMRKWALRRSDGFLSVTHDYLDFANDISATVKQRPHAVVYFGMDAHSPDAINIPAQKLDGLRKADTSEIWVVYGGTLGDNYDVATMVAAFDVIRREHPALKLRLKVAGSGPLKGLVEAAAGKHPEVVSYFGPLNKDELWTLLGSADIGLLPYAGFSTVSVPAKTFDYIAAGLPMINSLPGEIERILAQRGIGAQYQSGDVQSLAAAIVQMAQDRAALQGMRERARAAAQEYSKGRQYGQMLEVLGELFPQPPQQPLLT
jgi:glycosyltransferase involved in cell wall biosynthesis